MARRWASGSSARISAILSSSSWRMARWLGDDCSDGQPVLQPRCRLVERRVQRPFPADVPLAGHQLAERIGQVMAEDRTQPRGGRLAGPLPSRLFLQRLVGLEQRLLDDPGQVDLVSQPRRDLHPGQQAQVGAEPLQVVALERLPRRLLHFTG